MCLRKKLKEDTQSNLLLFAFPSKCKVYSSASRFEFKCRRTTAALSRRIRNPRKFSSREHDGKRSKKSARVRAPRPTVYGGWRGTRHFSSLHTYEITLRDQVGLYCYCLNSYVTDESFRHVGTRHVTDRDACALTSTVRNRYVSRTGEIPRIMNRKTPNCCGTARGKANNTFNPSWHCSISYRVRDRSQTYFLDKRPGVKASDPRATREKQPIRNGRQLEIT